MDDVGKVDRLAAAVLKLVEGPLNGMVGLLAEQQQRLEALEAAAHEHCSRCNGPTPVGTPCYCHIE